MIEAKELRIGNWVLLKCVAPELNVLDELEPTQINIHNLATILEGNTDWIFEPIPITEERLEEFGFRKTQYQYQLDRKSLPIPLIWHNCTLMLKSPAYGAAPLHGVIKHIHQLQNLFFALTGEELGIKEVEK